MWLHTIIIIIINTQTLCLISSPDNNVTRPTLIVAISRIQIRVNKSNRKIFNTIVTMKGERK